MTLASGPVLGSAAAGGQGLPANHTATAASPDSLPAAVTLPRGSVWAAQVGAIRADDFVLLVAGVAFDIPGPSPAPEGGTLMVRVVDDVTLPIFEVVAREVPQAQQAALRSLLAQLLRRALTREGAEATASANFVGAAASSSHAVAEALQLGAHDRLTHPTRELAHYLETGILRLDLRVPSDDASQRCRVEVHDEGADSVAGEDAVTATVWVELPETGSVEARLTLSAGRLQVHFLVGSDEVRDRLLSCANDLTAALRAAGFSDVIVGAQADPARLARERATAELPREVPHTGGLLDIRA